MTVAIFFVKSSSSPNISVINDYKQQLNKHANARDYLIPYLTDLQITTLDSIKLQACTLAKMTEANNQLTRTALVRLSFSFSHAPLANDHSDIGIE